MKNGGLIYWEVFLSLSSTSKEITNSLIITVDLFVISGESAKLRAFRISRFRFKFSERKATASDTNSRKYRLHAIQYVISIEHSYAGKHNVLYFCVIFVI